MAFLEALMKNWRWCRANFRARSSRFITYTLFFAALLLVSFPAASRAQTTQPLGTNSAPQSPAQIEEQEPVLTKTLGDLLQDLSPPKPDPTGFYGEITKEIDPAVRALMEERYSSATEVLAKLLPQKTEPKERARILMWLGLTHGQEALDYPTTGHETGTSSSRYLRQAIELDGQVFAAPDVARMLADMTAHGWGGDDVNTAAAIAEAERRAETTRQALDLYYAGCLLRRESMRAWFYSDTSNLDQRSFSLFAKAVARDPGNYEYWTGYLPSLMPIGLHDLMSTESHKMYDYFKNLRCPLIADQGPPALHLRTRMGYTMQDDDDFLKGLIRNRPDDPYGYYQLALWTIETTPPLAITRFEEFLEKEKAGVIKLRPREQGYKVSAMYKLAFLYNRDRGLTESLAMYRRVKEISPHYAEVNVNIALMSAALAEQETTGPVKLRLLEQAVAAAREQEKYDYRGKASRKAGEMARAMASQLRAVRAALKESSQDSTE